MINANIYWQFHQSTNVEMPQNTMSAFNYAWNLGGIPELDIRTSRDGVIICFHDDTPVRTAILTESEKDRKVSSFTFQQIREWDVGAKLSSEFKGEKVPSIQEVFKVMRGHPERQVYLDLKEVDLKVLAGLIDEYRVNRQVIFCHNDQQNCITMQNITSDIRTMLWIGGDGESIRKKFDTVLESGFEGLEQVQLHLNDRKEGSGWRYMLDIDFLKYALDETSARGIDLEVLPFMFDREALNALLDIGIRWYAVDEPKKFLDCVNAWNKTTK